ncbi:uncharacterized protein LOC117563484 isoform X3 [Drosophila albomicans]|uniref:Uncharacterized protein LOC117563484 isoform X3 n=1 Tax=Drosophila albomicans TaxID=7291 RepID=A0A6P8XDH8_DROAB|nr:uncharacterized protein LOC117563484 isoform X3 [Drosophila albomicans]
MLDKLNDDCWLEIIKYLDLYDKFALYEATKGVSNRVNSNVIYSWKHQLNFTLDNYMYGKMEEMPELLDIFISSIKDTVQKLIFQNVTVEFLKLWQKYTFPSMKTLKYTLDVCDYNRNDNEAIKIMATIFPGLHSVKPHGGVDSGMVPQWTQLRKLDLSEWLSDYIPAYGNLFILRYPLLEELIVRQVSNFTNFYHEVMTMSKLHTLTIQLTDDYYLNKFLEKRGNDIHTIVFNNCIGKYKMNTLHKLRNLRHLTLQEEHHFTSEDLCKLIMDLNQLEQIDLIYSEIWPSEEELWQTVASCPSLKILNIPGSYIDSDDFFDSNRHLMEDTLNKRSQPLTIHIYCDVPAKQICDYFKHTQLKLSFEPLRMDLLDDEFAQMRLNPMLTT